MKQNPRTNVVGQITHHNPRCFLLGKGVGERIGFKDLEPRCVGESFLQQGNEIPISLDGSDSLSLPQKGFSQVAKPSTNFENWVSLQPRDRGLNDLVLSPLIMEKILAPGFLRPESSGLESLFGVAQTSLCLAR